MSVEHRPQRAEPCRCAQPIVDADAVCAKCGRFSIAALERWFNAVVVRA